MAKHKTKFIAAAVILAVLTGAWFFGGNFNKPAGSAPPASAVQTAQSPALAESAAAPADTDADMETAEMPPSAGETPAAPKPAAVPAQETATPAPPDPGPANDPYRTDPVPSGKPAPVEPQDVTPGDGAFTVTLSVYCGNILDNMNLLDEEKHELVPADGVVFPKAEVTVYEGESVFNVLQREMKRAKIHLEFVNTPIYNSAYIEGLHNLYAFDAGELSGWMYAVNGWYPNYGCSRYQLQPGDAVEWNYTCDLGRDLRQTLAEGWQKDE
ncbi:MAG: DUF4430 domain-containing protein [Clostridiales Family XIII bacterium]|jgi:hypothetical protein|nr:DUF4430 domain-containing protein [Clostridiales Family XIII bacterium]